MPRELKPGFVPIPSNIPSANESEAKESAPIPSTLKEFREATENALDFGDKHLGLWSADGTELSTIAFEEWTSVSMDLDEMFFELRDGILGKQLLTFASLADAELVNPNIRSEIEALLAQTAPLAKRMNPLIDRLCAVNPTMSRSDIIATLREGELNATETLDYISKQPVRRSLLGIFHDLEERLHSPLAGGGPDGTSALWNFENTTISDLTPVVILSDPFSNDAESQKFWASRADEPILKRSQQKTQSIIYELESLRQTMLGNGEKKKMMDALDVIEDWLESNMILYRDGKEVDFELYHLGMEEPQEVDAIFGSLDIIKHDNPEFFVQLMGIDPQGGKSPYFGSFIHKALFNTQKTLEGIVTEAPNLVLKSSMKQLLRIDGTVQRWNFNETISEESLKAMAQAREEQEASAKTPEEKAQIRLFWQAILTKPTIELAVKRQLEAMKEVNLKELKSELLAKLNDQEHPMLALKAISMLPMIAFRDPAIKRRLTEIFGDESMRDPDVLRRHCMEEREEEVRLIFKQIPVFDYENSRPTNFFSTAIREAPRKKDWFGRTTERVVSRGYREGEYARFFRNILRFRVTTRNIAYKSLHNEEERKFFKTNLGGAGIFNSNPDKYVAYSQAFIDQIPQHDFSLWKAIAATERPQETVALQAPISVFVKHGFDEERDTCLAQVTLQDGKGAKLLMKEFHSISINLRKSDAAKVVKVMFEHLPDLTSYQKFEFLLKHAERFEEGDVMDFLTWLPVEEVLLIEIMVATPEKYPPVFLEYIQTLHQFGTKKDNVWIRMIDTAVGALLDEDDIGEGSFWAEKHVINFARTPGFDEVFVKYAKKIFEVFPDLPEKLYGEWGARMVRELEIVEGNPGFLKRMGELCPRDANDDVMGKWGRLRALGESVRFDERVVEKEEIRNLRHIVSMLEWSFRREFPEVTSESYREMRELFGERMLGFTEVEKKFIAVSGAQIVDIEEKERREAIGKLQEKLQEPDVQTFLRCLRDYPEEKKRWMLIYRAEGREEKNYSSGWFFVQSEADARTKRENMDGEFSLEKQQEKMREAACLVGLDPWKIRQRSINETRYDMTVAKELLPENFIEGIWKEASGSSFLMRISNGHPVVFHIADVPWVKAGMCVAR